MLLSARRRGAASGGCQPSGQEHPGQRKTVSASGPEEDPREGVGVEGVALRYHPTILSPSCHKPERRQFGFASKPVGVRFAFRFGDCSPLLPACDERTPSVPKCQYLFHTFLEGAIAFGRVVWRGAHVWPADGDGQRPLVVVRDAVGALEETGTGRLRREMTTCPQCGGW